MIALNNVSLQIKETQILKDIHAEFEAGKIHGIIGRNGSGKTMLMKCICGFVQPTGGEIRVNGKVVGKDMDFPADMGLMIETPGFIPYYSGLKNLKQLAALNKKITVEQIRECMELVGLDSKMKRAVKEYNIGIS